MIGMENQYKKLCGESGDYIKFIADYIEMTWHDLYWKVEITDHGNYVADEEVKIITLAKTDMPLITSERMFIEFETVRLSAPHGIKYVIHICDEEMIIETIKSN